MERIEKRKEMEKYISEYESFIDNEKNAKFGSSLFTISAIVFGLTAIFFSELALLVPFIVCSSSAYSHYLQQKHFRDERHILKKKISSLNKELDEQASAEVDIDEERQKTAGKRISSSAVQTVQLKPTVQPESRVEKRTTSVDSDSIFDENGCLQSLDALGDILGDDSGYSDDSPKVLKR